MLQSGKTTFFLYTFFSIVLLFGYSPLKAQEPLPKQQQPLPKSYSEDQLKKFAEATMNVQGVQMKYQQDMMTALKEEGLDPQKFSEIAMQEQNPESSGDAVYSDEDMQAYNNVMKKMDAQKEDMNAEMQKALKKSGMTMEQYQEMALTIQQSPEMQQKVMTIMQNNQ